MRYAVEFETKTGQWLVYDPQSFMLLGNYRSEEAALIAALSIEESTRQRRSQTSTSMRPA
jgi:hypothetical protein